MKRAKWRVSAQGKSCDLRVENVYCGSVFCFHTTPEKCVHITWGVYTRRRPSKYEYEWKLIYVKRHAHSSPRRTNSRFPPENAKKSPDFAIETLIRNDGKSMTSIDQWHGIMQWSNWFSIMHTDTENSIKESFTGKDFDKGISQIVAKMQLNSPIIHIQWHFLSVSQWLQFK